MGSSRRELATARAVAVVALVAGGSFVVVALAASLSGWTTTTRALAALGMAAMAFGAGLLLAAPGLYLPDPSPLRRFAQVALPVGLLAVLAPAAASLTVQALPAEATDVAVVAGASAPVAEDPTATTAAAQWPPPPPVYGGATSNIDQDLAGTARQALAGTETTVAGDGHDHSGPTLPGEADAEWAEQVQSELGGQLQASLAGGSAPAGSEPGAAVAPAVTPTSVAPGAFAEAELATHDHGQAVPEQPLDRETRALLGEELTKAREVALRFPTVADAEAAGYRMVTAYLPLIGAHYVRWDAMDGTFALDEPEMLLYDGTGPEARIVGLSYYVFGAEPDGFAGPNDHWHQHRGLCMRDLVVVGGERLTEAECAARGGTKVDGANGWMVHAWVVPGWDSPQGVFSPEHLGLV